MSLEKVWWIMSKKILIGISILVFLSLGSNLLAGPVVVQELSNLTLVGYSTQTPETSALSAMGFSSLTYLAKWDGFDNSSWNLDESATDPDGGTIESDDAGEYIQGVFIWNGSGIVEHIMLKADGYYALFALGTHLSPGEGQVISSDPADWITVDGVPVFENPGLHAISNITGYGTTSVPEPATLVLLGLGLMAVPLARKYTS